MSEEPTAPSTAGPAKRGPHYITDKKGKRLAAVVPVAHYKRLLQVHKRIARLEKQALAYQDIDSALDELRTLLAEAEAAQPVDGLLELLGEESQ